MDVIIIGGGIGGLTLALTLKASGAARTIRVFEAAAEMRALGVGINIGAHAMKELSALGLEDELVATSCQPQDYAFFTRHGQMVYREPFGKAAGHQWPHISLLRPDLQRVLLGAVRARIGTDNFFTGHRCTGIEQSGGRVTAHFAAPDGTALPDQQADILIACDGIHSVVRKQFYPDEGAFKFRGYNLWRGVSLHEPFLTGESIARIGARHSTMIIYPLRRNYDGKGNTLYNWVCEIERDVAVPVDWNKPGRLDDFLPNYQDWVFDWMDVPALVKSAQQILSYPMVDRDPVPHWSFERVTLLGDAAHPTLPYLAQGAAMSIEDGAVLMRTLAMTDSIAEALQIYQRNRVDRTAKIVLQSSANRELFHLKSEAEIRARFAKKDEGEDRNRWLYSYNPLTVELA